MKAPRPPAKRTSRAKKTIVSPSLWANRVVIENVQPEIDLGRAAAKRVIGDRVTVSADIFSDGHELLGAEVLFRPAGEEQDRRVSMRLIENDRWSGEFDVDSIGAWSFTVVAWRDPYRTWAVDTNKKIAAGQNVAVEADEGAALVTQIQVPQEEQEVLDNLAQQVRQLPKGSMSLIDLLTSPDVQRLMQRHGPRHALSAYPLRLPLWVDRKAARFSSWYELFPRSQGRDAETHGTFRDVIARLPYVRDLGFDVLYFTPIHPIGQTNRKGRNNSLTAAPGEPGSVYAIGGAAGGHDAVHPELGTIDDFKALVREAKAQDIEIALDFAVQCSPDHPWIKEHPEWFEWRPDGTIKFAENPPKKYEDIVNLRLDHPEVRDALLGVIRAWVDRGVRIFRVDNPHTKPVPFWEWLIAEINRNHPDVLFLAEAFTRPKMMRKLAKVGFQQSYTYFTWRNAKHEIVDYITELAGEMGEYYRPNFFVNTPDINPYYLQTSGRAGFIVRATLAATLSSAWGLYSGFELCEAAPLPGREEYLDSEKYELRHRDWNAPGNIKTEIRALNRIRREHPALQDFRNTLFLNAWNDAVIAYARMDRQRGECIFIMVNLDPHHAQGCSYEVPLWEFGLPDWERFYATDLLHGNSFTLEGKTHVISLDPQINPVIVWQLRPASGRRVP
jgi:starch synthase (maltosyl-transferring)